VVLILTGYASVESAIEALREGAYDYLVKPSSDDELKLKIERGLERVRLAEEHQRAEEEIRRRNRELAALNAVATTTMQSALDLDGVLQCIADGVVEGLDCNTAVILLLDEEGEGFKGSAVSTRGKIIERINAVIGFPLSQIKFPVRSDFNEAVSNALAGRTTIKHNLYELVSPALSKPICSALQGLLGSRTFLSIPLLARGKLVGGIFASTREELSEGDIDTMMTFANQAAIAIENARLFEAEARRRREAETLRQTALALTSALDRNRVIERILGQLHEVVPYDSASVQLLQGDRLVLIGGQGFPNLEELLGISFPVDDDNPNREVMRTLSHFILKDAPAVYAAFTQQPFAQMGIRSWLGVPMLIGERPVGMITLDKCQPGFYTQEHARLAQAFAAQAAIAIENARLFGETERLKAFNEGVVQGVAEAILIEDTQGILTFANPAVEELLGYTREELISLPWSAIVPEDEWEKVRQEKAKRPQGIKSRYETILLSKEGRRIPVIVGARPLFEEDKFAGVLSAFTDITAQKRMEDTLRALLLIDELTGLYNRRGFVTLSQHQLKAANRAKRRMLLLFADFDGLKQINDTFGHPEGDRVLIETADVLRETFRESDIVARIGGDEFVVLATATGGFSAENLTTRLQQNLEAHNAREGRLYKLSLSVGLAHYDPEHPCSIDELLAQADRAMYEQKQGNPW